MIERKTVAVDGEYAINVVTEQLADGWAVVASLRHASAQGEKIIDLPVTSRRFADQAEAEAFGVEQARTWLERNRPRAA
ncbi:MAG TPA: hypothetical protein VNN07_14565 [Candidatus Tectomicrobia bacterium]|nr:hypothetical protein [Candidatus Tectomicrobia bacterium]